MNHQVGMAKTICDLPASSLIRLSLDRCEITKIHKQNIRSQNRIDRSFALIKVPFRLLINNSLLLMALSQQQHCPTIFATNRGLWFVLIAYTQSGISPIYLLCVLCCFCSLHAIVNRLSNLLSQELPLIPRLLLINDTEDTFAFATNTHCGQSHTQQLTFCYHPFNYCQWAISSLLD